MDKWLIGAIISLIGTLFLGVLLSRGGKPYDSMLFNGHKFLALGTIGLIIYLMKGAFRIIDHSVLLTISFILMGGFVLGLFISGGLLSAGKFDQSLLQRTHYWLSIVFVGGLAYLIIDLTKKIKMQ